MSFLKKKMKENYIISNAINIILKLNEREKTFKLSNYSTTQSYIQTVAN